MRGHIRRIAGQKDMKINTSVKPLKYARVSILNGVEEGRSPSCRLHTRRDTSVTIRATDARRFIQTERSEAARGLFIWCSPVDVRWHPGCKIDLDGVDRPLHTHRLHSGCIKSADRPMPDPAGHMHEVPLCVSDHIEALIQAGPRACI